MILCEGKRKQEERKERWVRIRERQVDTNRMDKGGEVEEGDVKKEEKRGGIRERGKVGRGGKDG